MDYQKLHFAISVVENLRDSCYTYIVSMQSNFAPLNQSSKRCGDVDDE